MIERLKRSLAIVVSITTFAWAVGPAMLLLPTRVVAAQAQPGDLIKMEGLSSVYYLGADNKRYVFPNQTTYFSWYSDFSGVKTIPQAELESYSLGSNITMREGTKLVKITTDPKVYAVEPSGILKWIPDEATAITLYGTTWAKKVVDVPDAFFTNYTVSSEQVSSTAYPVGTLIKYQSSADVYLVTSATEARKIATDEALSANRYQTENIVTAPASITYTAGTEITAAESALVDPSATGVVPGEGGEPVGTGLSVSLSSTTPAAGSILSDGSATSLDGQALIPALKLNFTAGSDGAVTVKTLKLTRGGISADSDIDNAYLYDGDNVTARLAEMQSITSKVMTFSNSAGLFTVPAGSTKEILIRFDLNRDATSGKTIYFGVNAATDVTADGATISGTFPATGNTLSTASVTDFGGVQVSRVADNSTSVDPGTTAFTAAHYRITPANQNMQLEYVKLQMVGSAATTDITNIKLYDSATQIGTTQSLAEDKTVTFDLTAAPLAISSAQTKNLYVKCDVASGATRTFYFSIQKGADVIIRDTAYDIYLRPKSGSTVGSFTSQNSSSVTIGSGSLSISRTLDSPTGNIADGATNVTFAKYSVKATGEAIKLSNVGYYCTGTGSNEAVENVKILVDGTQLGTTDATITCNGSGGAVTTTINLTVLAGETKYITIVGDTTGANIAANDTIYFTLNTGDENAQRLSALTTFNAPASPVHGNSLAVKSGTIVGAKNTGMGDYSSANPAGVVGTKDVKIGSFTITAGAGEDVDITKINLRDNGTQDLGGSFENLKLKQSVSGEQIGDTITTLQTTTNYDYEFTPKSAIRLGNGKALIVDVYADILTNALDTSTSFAAVKLYSVTATGVSTSSDAGETSNVAGQSMYISASGSLLVENVAASDQVQSNIVNASVTGSPNEIALYKFKLTALTEAIDISRFLINDAIVASVVHATTANGKPTTSLYNFKLYNGDTLVAGPVALHATSTPTVGGYIDFNLSGDEYTVDAGTAQTLTLKATVNTSAAISSGSTHQFSLRTDSIQDDEGTKAITARGHDSNVDKSGPSGNLTSNTLTVRKAYPVVTRQALPSTILAAGSTSNAVVSKFNVTAVGGEVRLKKMTFEITLNDTTTSTALALSSFKLFRNGTQLSDSEYDIFDGTGTAAGDELSPGGSASLTTSALKGTGTGAPNTTSTRFVVAFTTRTLLAAGSTGAGEEIIGAGSTNTYEIKADIANAHQGATTDSDSVVVTMLGDDTQTTPYTGDLSNLTTATYRYGVMGLNATNYNFIWSDYSADIGSHSSNLPSTSDDWIHGYEVRKSTTLDSYLPLDSWTMAKQ